MIVDRPISFIHSPQPPSSLWTIPVFSPGVRTKRGRHTPTHRHRYIQKQEETKTGHCREVATGKRAPWAAMLACVVSKSFAFRNIIQDSCACFSVRWPCARDRSRLQRSSAIKCQSSRRVPKRAKMQKQKLGGQVRSAAVS